MPVALRLPLFLLALLLVATLVGGFAAAGSANAFNMIFDRDIDRLMNRTKQRGPNRRAQLGPPGRLDRRGASRKPSAIRRTYLLWRPPGPRRECRAP